MRALMRAFWMRAHPRVGGENPTVARPEPREAGSSPRGRGKLHETKLRARHRGLIPAWAGKTRLMSAGMTQVRAHPRVGGENAAGRARQQPDMGSSPRGRGKPPIVGAYTMTGGLIPAWAGKTVRAWP